MGLIAAEILLGNPQGPLTIRPMRLKALAGTGAILST